LRLQSVPVRRQDDGREVLGSASDVEGAQYELRARRCPAERGERDSLTLSRPGLPHARVGARCRGRRSVTGATGKEVRGGCQVERGVVGRQRAGRADGRRDSTDRHEASEQYTCHSHNSLALSQISLQLCIARTGRILEDVIVLRRVLHVSPTRVLPSHLVQFSANRVKSQAIWPQFNNQYRPITAFGGVDHLTFGPTCRERSRVDRRQRCRAPTVTPCQTIGHCRCWLGQRPRGPSSVTR
jgi:hypothetical protein